jgi:hypothetical protein
MLSDGEQVNPFQSRAVQYAARQVPPGAMTWSAFDQWRALTVYEIYQSLKLSGPDIGKPRQY